MNNPSSGSGLGHERSGLQGHREEEPATGKWKLPQRSCEWTIFLLTQLMATQQRMRCPPLSDPCPNNWLRWSLKNRNFVCTAELVLGRDHNASEAETFVKEAAQNGIRVISLTDLPGGNPAFCHRRPLFLTCRSTD